jgi:hypothetical protein
VSVSATAAALKTFTAPASCVAEFSSASCVAEQGLRSDEQQDVHMHTAQPGQWQQGWEHACMVSGRCSRSRETG